MPCVEGHVPGIPEACGLYDPQYESDACGVGFVVSIDGIRSNKVLVISRNLAILRAGNQGSHPPPPPLKTRMTIDHDWQTD